jgi:hypothetical protein
MRLMRLRRLLTIVLAVIVAAEVGVLLVLVLRSDRVAAQMPERRLDPVDSEEAVAALRAGLPRRVQKLEAARTDPKEIARIRAAIDTRKQEMGVNASTEALFQLMLNEEETQLALDQCRADRLLGTPMCEARQAELDAIYESFEQAASGIGLLEFRRGRTAAELEAERRQNMKKVYTSMMLDRRAKRLPPFDVAPD